MEMPKSLSRLRNPRAEARPEPKMAKKAPDTAETESGDPHHEAAEKLHSADPGSKHMILSHDGYSFRSHGVHEDGKHEPEEGTHDHENIEELKSHLGKFFNEEENEPKDEDGGEEQEENQSLY